MNPRRKSMSGGPQRPPRPPWIAGVTIGLVILGMASGAMALGVTWALSGNGGKSK